MNKSEPQQPGGGATGVLDPDVNSSRVTGQNWNSAQWVNEHSQGV